MLQSHHYLQILLITQELYNNQCNNLTKSQIYVKTQLGTSQHSYTHTPECPLYGIGQGVGNSLAVWALLSCTMVSVYSSHAHGSHIYVPSKLLHSQVNMVGFVNDTSFSINVFLPPKLHKPKYYINLATHNAQLWNNILSLSEGNLQAAKCWYHLLYFDFTSIGIPYLREDHISPMLQIKFNQVTSPTPLQNLTAYTSHKT